MKTKKTKGFPKYMTIDMNYDNNMFKLISVIEHGNKKQEH
jgi:hypothetical protein